MMNLRAICLALVLVPVSAGVAAAQAPLTEAPLRAETEEDRLVREIAYSLRCAVCQSESVGESNSQLARDMRDLIRKQVQQGKSRAEIEDFFVARYGQYILMEPRKQGLNWVLWIFPFGALLLGIGVIALRPRRRPAPTQEGRPATPDGPPEEELIAKLRDNSEESS
jgi:cytochrome c-type biogenesis protein CcmH